MKKAISFLTVLMLVLSFGIVGFADEDVPVIPGASPAQQQIDIAPYTTYTPSTSTSETLYAIGINELFLVDENNNIVGTDTLLAPDTTYKFTIYRALTADIAGVTQSVALGAANAAKLDKAAIGNNATVKVRTVKGSGALSSTKIRTTSTTGATTGGYQLEIVTRPTFSTKITDVELELYVTGTAATAALVGPKGPQYFQVGYSRISENDTDIGEGGVLTISNDAPVVLKEDFTDIAKSANYKNITIESEDGNWSFIGKVAGMKDTNFTYNYDPDENLMNKYPDQEFKFLSFPAGVNFPTTGEMHINVSDVSDDFDQMFVYLYRDGKLTQINGTYDSGADEIVFRTNYLGRFIVTNKAITEASVTEPEEEEQENIPGTNPPTGVATGMNLTAIMALTALGTGVVIRRKRK